MKTPGTGYHQLTILYLSHYSLQNRQTAEMPRLVGELRMKNPINIQEQDNGWQMSNAMGGKDEFS